MLFKIMTFNILIKLNAILLKNNKNIFIFLIRHAINTTVVCKIEKKNW